MIIMLMLMFHVYKRCCGWGNRQQRLWCGDDADHIPPIHTSQSILSN